MNKIKEKFNLISNTNKTLSIFLLIAISLSIIGIAFCGDAEPRAWFYHGWWRRSAGRHSLWWCHRLACCLGKNITATRYLSNTGATNNPAWAQIDLTNGVTGILPSGNGGTTNAFFTVSGPATDCQDIHLSRCECDSTHHQCGGDGGTGGTGLTSTAQGDILYSSAASTLSALAKRYNRDKIPFQHWRKQ